MLEKKAQKAATKEGKEESKKRLELVENNLINGCANITGGGLINNLIRVIPNKLSLNINLESIKKGF